MANAIKLRKDRLIFATDTRSFMKGVIHMANNEVIAKYVHWRDTYIVKEFVIMWSDHTWETIRCPFTDYWINNKSYKQHMQLNKVVSSKMTKEQAM